MRATPRWAGLMVIVAALVFIAPARANASPSCFAGTCTGLDPIAAGCAAGAITVATIPDGWLNHGSLALRYSPTCAAAWAKATDVGSVSIRIDVSNNNPAENYPDEHVWTRDGSGYTDMVNDLGSIRSEACDYYAGKCTSSY